jgi:DNA-binding Lrp family transcriptional regulator
MAKDIYERLAEHLDNLPGGFPRTESGVEIRILRRLFTPEDAKFAVHLTLIPEEARVIARRAKIPVEEASQRLEEMVKAGLISGVYPKNKSPLYMALQFVIGIWENQVNRLNRELIQDVEEYMPLYTEKSMVSGVPQLRTVPVGKSIGTKIEVMPYERAEELVRTQKTFAVSNCICRQEMRIMGEGCEKPEESCLTFGTAARIMVRTGRGRSINMEEALEILQRAEEVGLVLQPSNAQKAINI